MNSLVYETLYGVDEPAYTKETLRRAIPQFAPASERVRRSYLRCPNIPTYLKVCTKCGRADHHTAEHCTWR